MQDIEQLIAEEEEIYRLRKQKLIQEAKHLLNTREDQKLESSIAACVNEVNDLRNNAITIDSSVKAIQNDAYQTISGFEQLKNQKKNVELLINTLNSYLELNRIKEELPQAIESCNLEKCTKLGQVFNEIEKVIIKEFCQSDFQCVEQLIREKLVQFQKDQFELAVKQNDLDKITLAAGLGRVLKMESSLAKVKEIHAKELRKQLQQVEESQFDKIVTTYEGYDKEEYDYPFLAHFYKILSLIKPESFVANVSKHYEQEGVIELVQYLISDVCYPYFVGVFKRMHQFFEIEKMIKNQKQVQSYDNQLLQAISKKINLEKGQIKRIALFCEEIVTISDDYHQFMSSLQEAVKATGPISTQVEESITEELGKYLKYAQIQLSQQIIGVIQKSEPLTDLWNFDKSKFLMLTQLKETLQGNGFHEWLEEIFFLVRDHIQRALQTGDQVITSAHIAYISNTVIAEDLYQIALQLFYRYLKKEYFSPTSICIAQEFTVNNSFVILIFNLLANIPNYLRMLKSQIYSSIPKGAQSKMIVGAVEEMIETNTKKFQKLIEEKIKQLAEYLKHTIKECFEEIKALQFNTNELVMAGQEREYTKLFSGQFKMALKGLGQWKLQMTSENYELLSKCLAQQLAKSLEHIILQKKYHSMGAVILEKEIRLVVNCYVSLTNPNVKQVFSRVQLIAETLLQESLQDMEEFLSGNAVCELSMADIKKIGQLRVDLK